MASPLAQVDLAGLLRQAGLDGVRGSGDGVKALAEAFARLCGNRSDLKAAHARIGTRMMNATIEAYDREVEATKGNERTSPNRLKGQLRNALKSPSMVQSDARGIGFVDVELLRRRARHFRRLNFGTGEGGQSPSFALTLFDTRIGDVGFHQGPRPRFKLPPGLFLGPSQAGGRGAGRRPNLQGGNRWQGPRASLRGTGTFFPIGELPGAQLRGRAGAAKRRGAFSEFTKPIRPRRFLEAGLKEMTVAFPQEYDTLVKKWIDGATKAGGAFKSITVKAGVHG